MSAAWWRLTGRPIDIKAKPDEYKSSIAPPTNPKIATKAKIIKYQVGSSVVNAPIGSVAMAWLNSELLADSAVP